MSNIASWLSSTGRYSAKGDGVLESLKPAELSKGGTDATTIESARKNLGLEIGVDVQALIDGLSIVAVTGAAGDGLLIQDATDGNKLKSVLWENLPGAGGGISNVVEDATPQLGGDLDRNGNEILGMVIGTDIQAHSAVLDATTASFTTALETLIGTALQTGAIDTLAELNAIVSDATLIDTTDSRLSDARTPTAHTHPASEISDATANGQAIVTAADYAAMRTLLGLEVGTNVQAQSAFLSLLKARVDGGNTAGATSWVVATNPNYTLTLTGAHAINPDLTGAVDGMPVVLSLDGQFLPDLSDSNWQFLNGVPSTVIDAGQNLFIFGVVWNSKLVVSHVYEGTVAVNTAWQSLAAVSTTITFNAANGINAKIPVSEMSGSNTLNIPTNINDGQAGQIIFQGGDSAAYPTLGAGWQLGTDAAGSAVTLPTLPSTASGRGIVATYIVYGSAAWIIAAEDRQFTF